MPRDAHKPRSSEQKLNPNEISGIPAAAAEGALEGERDAQPEKDAMVDPRSVKVTGGVNLATSDVARAKDDRASGD